MPQDSSTGNGLTFPLHREHSDFASGNDVKLLSSNLQNVLGVKAATSNAMFLGEYPWLLSFGSQIDRMRHANLDDPSRDDLIRIAVTDAVGEWEPRARVETQLVGVLKTPNGRATSIDVKFSKNIVEENARSVDVVESTEVKIG
jgi:phage baseplate assembly protein W